MIARIVPAIPSFAVDGGFRYSVPPRLAERIRLGSLVRVPLGGRRVGGFVIGIDPAQPEGLRDVAAVSGASPVFDQPLLETLRWAAHHYLAPLAVMLARSAPPNLPPMVVSPVFDGPVPDVPAHPLDDLFSTAAGGRGRTTAWVSGRIPTDLIAAAAARLLAAGRSLMVIAPTGREVDRMAEGLAGWGDRLVTVGSDLADAAVTEAWGRAAGGGRILLGTPRVAAWPMAGLAMVVVVEEGRRAMKDRQTPTVHVRELVRARAGRQGFTVVFAGATPSLEVVAAGSDLRRPAGRAWPLVEVIDRRQDAPAAGVVSERSRRAIQATTAAGGAVFAFAHRRGYSAAARCISCRQLRRCPQCGSRPDPGAACRRCAAPLGVCLECGGDRFEPLGAGVGRLVEELGRVVGRGRVAALPADTQVTVGTEADLAELAPQELVVMVDIDGLIYGNNYRSAEEALRIGARLAGRLRAGSGHRLIVQTDDPNHPVIEALRRGHADLFYEQELAARADLGYPPVTQLMVLEVGSADPAELDADLRPLIGKEVVHGPAITGGRIRWLVQAADLTRFKTAARPVLQRWRDSGATLRIDADPIDL